MDKYELFSTFFNDGRVAYVKSGKPIRYNMRILDVGFRRKPDGRIGFFATIHSGDWREATIEAQPEDLTAVDGFSEGVERENPFKKKSEYIQAIENGLPIVWTHPQYGIHRNFRIVELNMHRIGDSRVVWDAVVHSEGDKHSMYHVQPRQLAIVGGVAS